MWQSGRIAYANVPPTAAEIDKLTEDVRYERLMFDLTSEWCRAERRKSAASDGFVMAEAIMRSNAYLEALIIHTRNLYDFFKSTIPKDKTGTRIHDDVFAVDFVSDWQAPSKAMATLRELIQSTNKRTHHITAYRQRVPKTDDSKQLEEIYSIVADLWDQFLRRTSVRHRRALRID